MYMYYMYIFMYYSGVDNDNTKWQEWKLRNLTFLDEVIQPRTNGHAMER